MPPPKFRPKFTVGRLMIAVAVLAVLFSFGIPAWIERRREHFQQLSRSFGGRSFAITRFPGVDDKHPKWIYLRAMSEKYQDAANHPWRPVAPDPPEPPGPE